jgi:hypothetical protein
MKRYCRLLSGYYQAHKNNLRDYIAQIIHQNRSGSTRYSFFKILSSLVIAWLVVLTYSNDSPLFNRLIALTF